MSIKLECSNCKAEIELPENISIERLNNEVKEFYNKHKTRIGRIYCKISNIFIRTFK